jgi:hypothetical protein
MKVATYDDMLDIWWKIADAMKFSPGESPESLRDYHAAVFEKCLHHLHWTIPEWNQCNENLRKQLEEKKLRGG